MAAPLPVRFFCDQKRRFRQKRHRYRMEQMFDLWDNQIKTGYIKLSYY
jgi:hypothetical protein